MTHPVVFCVTRGPNHENHLALGESRQAAELPCPHNYPTLQSYNSPYADIAVLVRRPPTDFDTVFGYLFLHPSLKRVQDRSFRRVALSLR